MIPTWRERLMIVDHSAPKEIQSAMQAEIDDLRAALASAETAVALLKWLKKNARPAYIARAEINSDSASLHESKDVIVGFESWEAFAGAIRALKDVP